jgi:hypothetical protein
MFLYFVVVRQPVWGTNDDVGMSMLGAGVWNSAQPTAYLLFINVLLGGAIQHLYMWVPSVPWYGIVFILILFASLIVLNHAVFRLRRDPLAMLLVGGACLATCLPALWHMQFTVISGLAALAGMSVLLSQAIRRTPGVGGAVRAFVLALTLLFVGGMMRFQSCVMVLVLTIPALGVLVFSGLGAIRTAKRRLLHVGIFVLVVLIGLGGLLGLERVDAYSYSKDPGWTEWHKLNEAKSEFLDYDRVKFNEQTKPAFDRVGWSENDYRMIMTWQYVDPVHFAPEKFQEVVAAAADDDEAGSAISIHPGIYVRSDLLVMVRDSSLLPVILVAAVLLVQWRKRTFAYLAVLMLAVCGLTYYLYAELGRAPLRVQLLLWFCTIWLVLMLVGGSRVKTLAHRSLGRIVQALVAALVGVSLVVGGLQAFRNAENLVDAKQQQYLGMRDRLASWSAHLPDDAIIYNIGSSFPFEYQLPLASFDPLRAVKGFVWVASANQSPTQRQLLAGLGLQNDFFGAMAAKPNVFLVTGNSREETDNNVSILRTYYREHYNLDLLVTEEVGLPALLRMEFRPI